MTMRPLAECSAEAPGEALRVVAPDLSGFPVTVPAPDPVAQRDPLWWSAGTVVGGRFIAKFAGHVLPSCAWCVRAGSVGMMPQPPWSAGRAGGGPACAGPSAAPLDRRLSVIQLTCPRQRCG